MKILIVEDEVKLREELKIFLENNGYEIITIDNFENTLNSIKKIKCDLILLDIGLPNTNGDYLLKELRKETSIPIIIVTSKNTEIDELISIYNGADDFITKPYNSQILLARIERLLKRGNYLEKNISYQDLILDITKSIIVKDNQTIDLSKNEFKILYYLLNKRGIIISRDELINYLWNQNEFVDDNTLTVNINRIRNKLEDLGYIDVIITKRGQGYIIL